MIGVTVDSRGAERALEQYVQNLQEIARQGLQTAAAAAQVSAVATIHATTTRRTGDLESNWSTSWRGPFLIGLTNFSDHARFIDSGTAAHIITAKNTRFLRFDMNGQTMFRRSVNHPGTKPRPFVALALAAGEIALRASLESGRDRLAHEF